MPKAIPDLVSTEWLASRETGEVAILDASMHLPAAGRDPRAEYDAGHIPGAQFLDLASLTDKTSSVPAAIPNSQQLSSRLAELGAGTLPIVLYDDSDVRTSARAWFILRAYGIENVAILDGGMSKWRSEGRPLDSSIPSPMATSPSTLSDPVRIRSKADMLANLDTQAEQVLDARSADRVFGTGTDPVHGGANGRIPGALNLPFGQVFNADGTYKSPDDLRSALIDAGVDIARPVVTSCGSGVTASVLLFAMHLIGKHDTALYDGSWSEWGADPDTPKLQGPA